MSDSGTTHIDLSDASWFETGAETLASIVKDKPQAISIAAEGADAPEVPEAQYIAVLHHYADSNSIKISVTGTSEDYIESLRRLGLEALCERLEG